MGFLDIIRQLFPGAGHGVLELAHRLGIDEEELRAFQPSYREFEIPKRRGGHRKIEAPDRETLRIQRRILRGLLARLEAHPSAMGFERGRSIVDNALPHVGSAVVVRLDLQDFFRSTRRRKLAKWFRRLGYDRDATRILVHLTTHRGGLPTGAPTSPRLSTLVNRKLDVRLERLAARFGAVYTRYADDLTFSFATADANTAALVSGVAKIVRHEGYRLHRRRKLSVRRQHQRQTVTGLVVNEKLQLPRETRRWLRAVEHRERSRNEGVAVPEPTLTPEQIEGWRAFRSMVEQGERRGEATGSPG